MIPARLVVLVVATAIAWIAFASQTGAEHAHHTPPTHQFPAAKTTTVLDWEHVFAEGGVWEFTADHSCTQVTVRLIGEAGVEVGYLAGADGIVRFRVHDHVPYGVWAGCFVGSVESLTATHRS